jgi:hypothetical protein
MNKYTKPVAVVCSALLIVGVILLISMLTFPYFSEIRISRLAIYSGLGLAAIVWLLIREFKKRADN